LEQQMERALTVSAQNDSEDSLRDLFANTNSYFLISVLTISLLHVVFEIVAIRHDILFFQSVDVTQLNRYVSVNSIVANIVMQVLVLLYLFEESANFFVTAGCIVGICVDSWKVLRAWRAPIPADRDQPNVNHDDDFTRRLMAYLLPVIIGYGIYTLKYDYYRSWYSFFVNVSACCVYWFGFIMMTPQVYINHKEKTVAYLPWTKLACRFVVTFIDDLWAFMIRMPNMHRLACFRDDIIFFIYIAQWYMYPVDRNRED